MEYILPEHAMSEMYSRGYAKLNVGQSCTKLAFWNFDWNGLIIQVSGKFATYQNEVLIDVRLMGEI